MSDSKNKGGRPEISEEQKQSFLRKLQPYLQSGMNMGKALQEAQIPKSTFYDLMRRDVEFSEEIQHLKNYISVLVNNAIIRELMIISEKQNGNSAKGIMPQPLSKDDRKFLWKFALNSNLTTEEFGRRHRTELFDPEAEIQKVKRIIEENSSKEIYHPN